MGKYKLYFCNYLSQIVAYFEESVFHSFLSLDQTVLNAPLCCFLLLFFLKAGHGQVSPIKQISSSLLLLTQSVSRSHCETNRHQRAEHKHSHVLLCEYTASPTAGSTSTQLFVCFPSGDTITSLKCEGCNQTFPINMFYDCLEVCKFYVS